MLEDTNSLDAAQMKKKKMKKKKNEKKKKKKTYRNFIYSEKQQKDIKILSYFQDKICVHEVHEFNTGLNTRKNKVM